MSFNENINDLVEDNENGLLSKHLTWHRITVKEIATIINGYAFDSKKFTDDPDAIPLIRIRDIRKIITSKNYDGEIPEGYWVEFGDILIGMDGDFNCSRWQGKKALLNQRVCKSVVDDKIYDSQFYFYCIKGYLDIINRNTSSVTVKHLSSGTIKSIPLPLPPLNEQKRIAQKLDEILAIVESVKNRLNNAPKIIKRFRKSIFTAATSGKLTAEWREENGGSWQNLLLGDVLPYYAKNSKIEPHDLNDDTWVLELEDIEKESSKLLQIVKYSDRKSKSTKNVFNKGDILYGKLRPYLDKVIIAQSDGVCTTEIIPIRANENVLKEYIFYVLKSPKFLQYIEHATHGLSMPRLGTKAAKEAPFSLPTIKEQKEIVSQVESLFELVDVLEIKIEAAKKQVDKLTQSILAKAFRGELVPQDPNDEPADKLLERIKLKKEVEKPIRRVKKVLKKNTFSCDSIEKFKIFLVENLLLEQFTIEELSLIIDCNHKKLLNLLFLLLKDTTFVVADKKYNIHNLWINEKQVFTINEVPNEVA